MADEVGKPIMVGGGVVDGQPKAPTQLDMTNHMRNRRMHRAPRNSLDICTVVSIFPKAVVEYKPTLEPNTWVIPAGSMEKPGICVVTGASWWKDYDPDQPILEVMNSSIQIAESIVRDYCNSILGCNMSTAMPGLFFVEGKHTSEEIKIRFSLKLAEVNLRQMSWYKELVRLADSLWTRANGNPLVIWEEMKTAALALNLTEKAWLKDHQQSELVRCFACGNMRNPAYPICPTCKVVDQTHPLSKDLKFAV